VTIFPLFFSHLQVDVISQFTVHCGTKLLQSSTTHL